MDNSKVLGFSLITVSSQGHHSLQNVTRDQAKAQEKSIGTALVGGPFTLSDCNGKPFPSSKLHGEFAILYFGFTHCPDICPDELEKMAEALNRVGA